ncbi:MAG: helix-turn-helix transcriptional regulator [Lachnospiraceae bacterium]|nr:helix-turn-helix transcriptional regulator [Lachnospiraceae bacterium]
MREHIGKIIAELRKEAGFTQSELCHGLYSVAEFAKIEADQLEPGYFQLDCLFSRMGKTSERLEYVLPKNVYELYELRYQIQTSICRKEFEKAESFLQIYERRREAVQPLHRQYILQEQAQIAWMKGVEPEKVLDFVEEAIEQTVSLEAYAEKGNALGAAELKLLLFRWEVSQKLEDKCPQEELEKIFLYLEKHHMDEEERARVYPYAVLLKIEKMDWKEEYEEVCSLLKDALELLRDEGRILYLPEILKKYAEALALEHRNSEKVETFLRQRDALLALEAEFQIHLEEYRLFYYLNRNFELDYEVVRQERKAKKLTQAELAEGICEPESLSRIESGRRNPNNRNMEALLGKMNRERQRIMPMVFTKQYDILVLERKIAKAMHYFEYEEAEKNIEKLESRLDMTEKRNQQYVAYRKLICDISKGKIDPKDSLRKLYELLQCSIGNQDVFAYRLTETESSILNNIACVLEECGEEKRAIEIWKKILENYENSRVHPVFHIRSWELMKGNAAGTMEGIGCLQEAMTYCKRWLELTLSIGKGNEMIRAVSIIACILEKVHEERYLIRFRQALDLFQLMKMEQRYQWNREYLEEKGLLEKVNQISGYQYYCDQVQ